VGLFEDFQKAIEVALHYILFFSLVIVIILVFGLLAFFNKSFGQSTQTAHQINATTPLATTLTNDVNAMYNNFAFFESKWIYALVFGILFVVAFLVITSIRQEE